MFFSFALLFFLTIIIKKTQEKKTGIAKNNIAKNKFVIAPVLAAPAAAGDGAAATSVAVASPPFAAALAGAAVVVAVHAPDAKSYPVAQVFATLSVAAVQVTVAAPSTAVQPMHTSAVLVVSFQKALLHSPVKRDVVALVHVVTLGARPFATG